MGKYEVTVAQFRRFVLATGYRTSAEKGDKGCWTIEAEMRTTGIGQLAEIGEIWNTNNKVSSRCPV